MRDELSVLSAFLAVADERSFTRAAKRLNISTSGLSHAIRRLEEQIGVRLLTRTTRSVSPTDAGEQLLAQLRPALSDIRGVLTSCPDCSRRRSGVSGSCVRGWPQRPSSGRSSDSSCVTIRPSSSRSRPTTAVSISCPPATTRAFSSGNTSRRTWWPFACRRISGQPSSPHPPTSSHTRKPTSPRDLLNHQCIRFRHRGESVYKWELDKGDESLAIAVNGSLLLDELDLVIQAALDGAGLAWVAEDRVTEHLASGALVRVLEDWCPPFPGFFVYYPSRRQQPAALTALIDTLRLESDRRN